MDMHTPFEIFLTAPPGLETELWTETREAGFPDPRKVPGGVTFEGTWPDVWRANLVLRGATRVLARIGAFRAFHLAQLDKRARKFDWGAVLPKGVPLRVEVSTSKRNKIYHAGAAKQRVETALLEEFGAPIAADAPIQIKLRIEDNNCLFSVDTSGESLHKRGHKEAVAKAPMRETLASLFLRQAGFDGTQPVLDPMCGSGTFVIEAAETAMGLFPGRSRSFAFELLPTFNDDHWQEMRNTPPAAKSQTQYFGSDRNDGAIAASLANAKRAGVDACTTFERKPVSELTRPEGPVGIVIVNPPYGTRIGNKKLLYALHATLGDRLKEAFSGWSVGIVTTEASLARATGLPFLPPGPPVPHGGLKVKLYRTAPLP
ncbi:class I SAM-dependent RNA methyltransferase [Shimia sp. SDUM112013]|uniref:THUMP domain-containing class I SAM-dependent RNA methyltransferase n=1 Tax=Shimia sp. SDUM112013 TaxID=3136160 RepID=UPI0032ED8D0B